MSGRPALEVADIIRRHADDFLLPVKVLSRVFRGKFLDRLRKAYDRGTLSFHGNLIHLSRPEEFQQLLSKCYAKEWVVYAKRPFGGPKQVLKYLARYTYRVALSNHRLVLMKDGRVTFRWKDYAGGNREKLMTLEATEFLRRFLQHLLPSGFMRIRQYGLLANCHREAKLNVCRKLLAERAAESGVPLPEVPEPRPSLPTEQTDHACCPKCKTGKMWPLLSHPRPTVQQLLQAPWPLNSS